MRLGIKGKQVLGVTAIVGVVVVVVSLLQLARLAQVSLDESRSRAELVADAVFHRAREVVAAGGDREQALRSDPGLRSILESSLYSKNVTFAAIADAAGVALVHADQSAEGRILPPGDDLGALVSRPPLAQLGAIYAGEGRTLEFVQPLLVGDTTFGSIRIGVSTLLIRRDLDQSLRPAAITALVALAVAVLGATLLAQWVLRPIHVIRSGLTRLGSGEFGVRLDLDRDDEFGELGASFNTMSAQLLADRSQLAGQAVNLESAVERFEDAVAIVSPGTEVLFANPAMRALVPGLTVGDNLRDALPPDHLLRRLTGEALAAGQSRGPVQARFPGVAGGQESEGERRLSAHPVNGADGTLVGVMLVARNLEYLNEVQSAIRYSRRLAALGKLSAGVAHEVKNPLNAMMIHLELLKQQLAAGKPMGARALVAPAAAAAAVAEAPAPVDRAQALGFVETIAGEIRRLDEVVQGFLKFSRPEDLQWQPVNLKALFDAVFTVVRPEAERLGVRPVVDCDAAPDASGDPAVLRQAFLNLALNACQAMPGGGTLTVRGEAARNRRVAISVTDTGVGIAPEHLSRIFDLYFTTKPSGSGIGLSMVYRTIQMHDGDIEVESTPGAGTTFRILLPQA